MDVKRHPDVDVSAKGFHVFTYIYIHMRLACLFKRSNLSEGLVVCAGEREREKEIGFE